MGHFRTTQPRLSRREPGPVDSGAVTTTADSVCPGSARAPFTAEDSYGPERATKTVRPGRPTVRPAGRGVGSNRGRSGHAPGRRRPDGPGRGRLGPAAGPRPGRRERPAAKV